MKKYTSPTVPPAHLKLHNLDSLNWKLALQSLLLLPWETSTPILGILYWQCLLVFNLETCVDGETYKQIRNVAY